MTGTLYLIPNFLGDTPYNSIFPLANAEIIKKIKYFVVEKPKSARLLLKKSGLKPPYDDLTFFELNKHTETEDLSGMIKQLLDGKDMGLITEAGYPSVADPGEAIVELAQVRNLNVVPLIGPSSILLALAASGLNAELFTFHGYLPINKSARNNKIRELEKVCLKTGYTQIFIETPYRNQELFNNLIKNCRIETMLTLAVDITTKKEHIKTKTVDGWRNTKIDLNKRQVVFLLGQPFTNSVFNSYIL